MKSQNVRRQVDDEQDDFKVDPEWEAGLSVGVEPETIRWDGVLCALPAYAGAWSGGALRLPAGGFCARRFFASVHGVRVSPTRPKWTRRVRPHPHAALPAGTSLRAPPRQGTEQFTVHGRHCEAMACALS
jgi:hypothetical protein